MKEPGQNLNKGFFKRSVSSSNQISSSSFITTPNPLKQFSVKNFIIPEALGCSSNTVAAYRKVMLFSERRYADQSLRLSQ